MACDPDTLPNEAGSLCCIPPGMQAAVQSYLLARIRGGSMDVNQIMQETACQFSCIPPGLLPRIRSYLLCQLSNTGGGEIPVVTCTPDSSAQAFITAAGLTDETQISAVCQLVSDLKTYPAVGTKYWNRDILIYPFVGGNAAAHAVNLKTPGTNNITWNGAGMVHSALGVQGDGAASYGNTGWAIPPANLNNMRFMFYMNRDATALSAFFGSKDQGTLDQTTIFGFIPPGGVPARFSLNDRTVSLSGAGARPLGAYFVQRREAPNKQYSVTTGAWSSFAIASIAQPLGYMYLFAQNNKGVPPAGPATNYSNCRLSSWSAGTVLDPVGVTQVEKDEYKGIWDRFNIRLGRGHP